MSPSADHRPAPPPIPLAAGERETLETFLDFYRAALLDRAWGLTHDQLQIALPPSSLTLSRLIGHMAYVEQVWFRERLLGHEFDGDYADFDWDADVDAEMTLAQTWTVEELFTRFRHSVEDSRRRAVDLSLDALSVTTNSDGERWSLRWILVHMIEEYARHCGHADLIREAIDGDNLSS